VTVHPELERIFGIGAPRLAIEYEGWGGDQSGMEDVWNFEDVQEDVFTSSPKGQRGIKRGKGVGGVTSDNIDNMETDGSDNEDSEAVNMALGSSCITSGSDSENGENDNKKPRLDDANEASNHSLGVGSDRQEVIDIASVAGVTRKEDEVMSSGVAGAITLEKSSNGEEGQE
jgi:hypothetical protein